MFKSKLTNKKLKISKYESSENTPENIIVNQETKVRHKEANILINVETKCGEIMILENQAFIMHCTLCTEEFQTFLDFTDHYFIHHFNSNDETETTSNPSASDSHSPIYVDEKVYTNNVSAERIKDLAGRSAIKSSHVSSECYNNIDHHYDCSSSYVEVEESEYLLEDVSKINQTVIEEHTNLAEIYDKNNKDLISINNIKNNQNILLFKRKLVCEVCGKIIANKSAMIRHIRTHTGERPYQCKNCGKGFKYKNHCQRHELLHVEEKIYECEYCYLKFSKTDDKKLHESYHTDDDKKKVLKIGKKLAQISTNPANLLQMNDDSVPEGYWRCNICEKILKNSYKPEDHHRLHTGEKPYICDVCGKGMFSQSNLLRHVATHTENRRYKCTQCPAAFYCSTHLKRHENSHSLEKKFHCESCDMKFGRKEHLTAHQVRHLTNRQRNHKCEICDKSYLDMNALRQHKKKHNYNNDTFMCSTCPAVFQLKDALKRHEKRHTNKGLYKCDYCPNKRFNDKDDKNQHEKRCHMDELKRDKVI